MSTPNEAADRLRVHFAEQRRLDLLADVDRAVDTAYRNGRQRTVDEIRARYRETNSYRVDEHRNDLDALLDSVAGREAGQ